MGVSFDRIEKIKQFLEKNPHLSAFDAAAELSDLGIHAVERTIYEYRVRYNIPYTRPSVISDQIKKDWHDGMRFKNSHELARYYKCSPSHAKKIIREMMGLPPEKRVKQVVETPKELPPVRVNTFAHAIQQLTA